MLKRVLCLMLTLAMMSLGITAMASEELISEVVIAEAVEVGKNLEVTYNLADGVSEEDVTVNWYVSAPGDDVFYDTGITGKNFLVEYAHSGMSIKAKVSCGEASVWSNTVTESLTALVSADDKYSSDLVISASDGYAINSGTVQRIVDENVLEYVAGSLKAKATRTFPAVTGQFAFTMKLKHNASAVSSTVIGGSGGVATIITYNGTKIQISVLNDAGNGATTVLAGSAYAIGEWHLLSGAFDSDSDTFSFYIDGKKVFDRKGFRTVSGGVPVDIKNISYVYTELSANAAGNAYVDNLGVRKIHPLPVCEAPVAENAVIIGSNKIGSNIAVDYDYIGDYMEYGTEYSWYASIAENGNYTKLDKTGETLAIDDALAGMYIKAAVTPSDVWGTKGEPVFTGILASKNAANVQLFDGFDTLPAEKFSINASGDNTVSVEDGSLKMVFTDGAPIATYSLNKPLTGKVYVDMMFKNVQGQSWCRVKGSAGDGIKMAIDAANNLTVNGTKVTTLTTSEWCRVKLAFTPVGDTTTAALDVYVNGVKKASGLALAAAISNVTSVATAKTTAGTLYMDELKVFGVDLNGGVLDNGIVWKYNSTTKTLTFSGEGALPDFSTVVDKADPTYFTNKDWNSFIAEVETAVIEEGITAVGSNCFRSASKLKKVTLPSTCESINAYAFIRSGVETITIPEGVKAIGDGAFAYATTLTEVTLPKSLTNIHTYAFGGDIAVSTIKTYNNTAAEKFAKAKGIYVVILDAVNTTKYDSVAKTATIYAPEAKDDVTVLFASYSEGKLKTVKFTENVDLIQGENTVTISDFAPAEGDQICVFVWSDMINLTPVAEAFIK